MTHQASALLPLKGVEGWTLQSHFETLKVYILSSRKFTTHTDRYKQYKSNRVVILIETKFVNYKCLHGRAMTHQASALLPLKGVEGWTDQSGEFDMVAELRHLHRFSFAPPVY